MVTERIVSLRKKLAGIPESPGVYLHRDSQGKVIYVGKARNLRGRLHSYFYGIERQTPKTQALVSRIADFEIIVTANEHESLVLENNLIKFHKPQYNILLRDDKTYPFLRIQPAEAWPQLVRTRRRKPDNALYFGPYTSGPELTHITRLIDKFFLLVKCKPSVFRNAKRPCNYYHIKQCLAPCALPVSRDVYLENVKAVIAVLNGKTSHIKPELERRMHEAAGAMQFELAAQLRDQIRALENISQQKQSVHLDDNLNIDFVGTHWQNDAMCFYVARMRNGKLLSGDHFVVERLTDAPPHVNDFGEEAKDELEKESWQSSSIEGFLCQYYMRNEPPALIIAPCVSEFMTHSHANLLEQFLNDLAPQEATLIGNIKPKSAEVARLQKHKGLTKNIRALCETANETAKERFKDWMRTSESAKESVERLGRFLQMESLPVWMECFDISTFQGSETVASQVAFRNGKPARGEYRRYIIRDVHGQDDFGSLREVMRRRFKEEKRHELPDLLVIDGGEPQVREVCYMLKALGLGRIGVVGLAKSRTQSAFTEAKITSTNERLVIPARIQGELAPEHPPLTKVLTQGSPEFRLLTHMRDEAHRFAITLHRKRRDKISRMSALHRIEGLGPKRRKALLAAFENTAAIANAAAEEIAQKAKIPVSVAKKVKEILKKTAEPENGKL
jgi:excinuclease ABC subunit C